MTIIDSQVHAYEANTPKRPWHSVPNWPDHATGDEMVAAMDKVVFRYRRQGAEVTLTGVDEAGRALLEGMGRHDKEHLPGGAAAH